MRPFPFFPIAFFIDHAFGFPINSSAKLKSPSWVQFHSFKDFPGISSLLSGIPVPP